MAASVAAGQRHLRLSTEQRIPSPRSSDISPGHKAVQNNHKIMEVPMEERVYTGKMTAQAVTSKGIKWHNRFAILSAEYLAFTKHFELSRVTCAGTCNDQLRRVFDQCAIHSSRELQRDEARRALHVLNVYTTESTFVRAFEFLDTNGSGRLDFESFKGLADQSASCAEIIDFIPLAEIKAIDFEILETPIARCVVKDREEGETHAKSSSSPEKTSNVNTKEASMTVSLTNSRKTGSRMGKRIANFSQRTSVSLVGASKSALWTGRAYGFLAGLLSTFESLTGYDVDGDGKVDKIVIPDYDANTHELHLIIETEEGGRNCGRVYVHVVPGGTAQEWMDNLTRMSKLAFRRRRNLERTQRFGADQWAMRRAKARDFYNGFMFQFVVASLIVTAFVLDMIESQVLPAGGTAEQQMFYIFDAAITAFFVFELALNLFAHSENYFSEWARRGANWFDGTIVLLSLLNVFEEILGLQIPNAKMLRLIRIMRVVRLFSRAKTFAKLFSAISDAIIPVCNAFFILLVITSMYAILGTNLFRYRSPLYFGTFHTSLFTMFQVLSGDSWASAVARSIFAPDRTDADVAFFFVSYILIAAVMLLNVVVAVLLDEFIRTVTLEKEKQREQEKADKQKRQVGGCLDPLTETLTLFEDDDDLTNRIADLYAKLDQDASGGLTFEELRSGVREGFGLSQIHMTSEDFDVVTDNGRLLNSRREFNAQQFQHMMKGELWRFSRRELNRVLGASGGDEQLRAIILMLKLHEAYSRESMTELKALIRRQQSQLDLLTRLVTARHRCTNKSPPQAWHARVLQEDGALGHPTPASRASSDSDELHESGDGEHQCLRRHSAGVTAAVAGERALTQDQDHIC